MFITFEGPEGSGKSTQVELLSGALAQHSPVVVREPGGTALGESIRDLLLHRAGAMDAEAEMYLFMAARRQLLSSVIQPALAAGRIVIADRYHDSTLAYQGGGRGQKVGWPSTFPLPDITFLLALSVEAGRRRQSHAAMTADRMEQESIAFHERVVRRYDELAAASSGRIVRLDGDRAAADVHADVMQRLAGRLPASS